MPNRPSQLTSGQVAPTIKEGPAFSQWMEGLRDKAGRAVIARRIDRLKRGSFGDCKSVGDGVSELRIDVGPGYRVYFTERQGTLIILLCGGDKGSQARDIRQAQKLAAEFKR